MHFYLKCWEKRFVFDNINVDYLKITQRKLTSWYATRFFFKKQAMIFLLKGKTSFESHENSYWFLKNSSRPIPFTIFYWKLINFHNASINKKVRQKIIHEKSKIYKNQTTIKLASKKVLSFKNRWENAYL
jgi:hypothetical protein